MRRSQGRGSEFDMAVTAIPQGFNGLLVAEAQGSAAAGDAVQFVGFPSGADSNRPG